MPTVKTPESTPLEQELLEQQARAWVRLLASGRATERDAHEFKVWRAQSERHVSALRRARVEWREIGAAAAEVRSWSEVSVGAGYVPNPGRRHFLGWGVSAAAAVVVLSAYPPLGLWPSLSELQADHRTAKGEQRQVTLAGNVSALMNTQTTIMVRSQGHHQQIELLSGEVALEHDQAEIAVEVIAGKGRIELHNGGIEVRSLSGLTCLSCLHGAATLRHPEGTLSLSQGQQVYYNDDTLQETAYIEQIDSAWRAGVVLFRETPLREVIDEINRYRIGRVVLMDRQFAERRLSGRFAIDSLDEALAQVQRLFDIRVRHLAGGIVLLG